MGIPIPVRPHIYTETAIRTKCTPMIAVIYPDSKIHGANMGPTWVLSAWPQMGPMMATWALPSGYCSIVPSVACVAIPHVSSSIASLGIYLHKSVIAWIAYTYIRFVKWQEIHDNATQICLICHEPQQNNIQLKCMIAYCLGPLLLTWFNFNPSMDK